MNREQCNGCVYFKSAGGEPDAIKFCHYLLHTGQRRKVGQDDVCLSRSKKKFTLYKRTRTQKKTG
jgi:hypothetical protein